MEKSVVREELVHGRVKHELDAIAKGCSEYKQWKVQKLKSFDPPKGFQSLKRHEQTYVMNN